MNNLEHDINFLFKKVEKLEDLTKATKHGMDDFISEKEAKELLGRGTTWFWERRRAGMLPYKKLGGQVYYRISDLIKLFKDGGC